jgi:uncharacterized protein (TIGR03067 family)
MKSMSFIFLVGLTVLISSSLRAADDEAVKKEIAKLQGEWSMVSGSANGQPMPAEMLKQMKRVCKGDETTTTMAGQLFMKAKIAIDASKNPKTIDYRMSDGPTKDKTQLGIYETNGDTFRSCFASPGAERPTDFSSKPGDGRILSTWKREKQPAQATESK